MRDSLFVLGAAAIAVVCCVGVSLLVAAGGVALLGVVGVALPIAVLLGVGGWTAWYLRRRPGPR